MSELSFSTMLGRINKMGCLSAEPKKVFQDLLSPAAIAQWGFAKIGSKRVIKRKLLGRILAYTRTNQKNMSSDIAAAAHSPFVTWLMSECATSKSSKKSHLKFCGDRHGIDFVKSWIGAENSDAIEYPSLEGDAVSASHWSSNHSIDQVLLDPRDDITEEYIASCVENEQHDELEESLRLRERANRNQCDHDTISTARRMLGMNSKFEEDERFVRILIKWIPRLLQISNDDLAYQTLFIDLLESSVQQVTFMSIVSNCAMQWPLQQIQECQRWIIEYQSKSSWKNHRSMNLVLRFLVLSSEYHVPLDDAGQLIELSLNCNNQDSVTSMHHHNSRNTLPDWLALLLSVAKEGPSYLDMTVSRTLDRVDHEPNLSTVILRLYTLYPRVISLTDKRLKSILLQCSRDHSEAWLSYSCPLDGQIKAMITNLSSSPHKSLLQSTIQIANQHPLLLIRHLDAVKEGLINDGSGLDSNRRPLMKRGRIQGKPPSLIALINGRHVNVSVVHWGYSFSEPVWSCMLDLLLSIPVEVLFKVGVAMGLPDIMNVYSKLFTIHVSELSEESNIIQLRLKFNRLLSSFKNCNPEGYQNIIQAPSHGFI
jgi:hypothetical protein